MSAIATAAGIVDLTMRKLLPGQFDTAASRLMLLAIGLQESRFEDRQQIGGPARSYWQFEQAGGIRGVLTHSASSAYARSVCGLRAVATVESDVYAAFLSDDLLACAFARLLLWTDAAPMPQIGDEAGAWAYYLRCWRPGAYTRGDEKQRTDLRTKWSVSYQSALAVLK